MEDEYLVFPIADNDEFDICLQDLNITKNTVLIQVMFELTNTIYTLNTIIKAKYNKETFKWEKIL